MNRFNNYEMPGMPPVLSWNPVVMRCKGCGLDENQWRVAEPGEPAKHCWHLRACDMGSCNQKLPQWMRDIKAGIEPACIHPYECTAPVRRKKPAIIATQFMGDVSQYTKVQWEVVLSYINHGPQHIFLMLTKWPERIKVTLPDNAWMGRSVINQKALEDGIDKLLAVKASHFWMSVEPIMGPVNMTKICDRFIRTRFNCLQMGIEFVACGPETGPKARPYDTDWIDSVEQQCIENRVPFYNKSGGRREWPDAWKRAVAP